MNEYESFVRAQNEEREQMMRDEIRESMFYERPGIVVNSASASTTQNSDRRSSVIRTAQPITNNGFTLSAHQLDQPATANSSFTNPFLPRTTEEVSRSLREFRARRAALVTTATVATTTASTSTSTPTAEQIPSTMVDFAAYAHRNGWLIPTNGFDEPIRYRVADDVPPEYQMAVQAVIVVRDLDESRPTSRPSVPRNLGEIIRQSADTSAAEVAVGNNQPSSTDRMIHGHFTFSSLPGNRVRVGHFETQDFGEESYAELLAAHHHSAMNNHNDDDEEEEEEALQLPDLEDGEEEDEDGVNDVPMIVPVSNEEVHRSGGRRAMANLVGGWRNASQRRTIEIENEGRCRTCALKSTRLVTCSSKFCRLPSCENCVDVVGKRDPKDRRIVLCAQCVEHSVDFKGAPQKEKCLIRVEKKDGKIYLSIDED